MPSILRLRDFWFLLYTGGRNEPRHIHIEHGENAAKF